MSVSAPAPRSLQGRLLAGLLGAVVVVWTVTALITWRDARHELDELLDSHLAQAAALLVAQQSRGGDEDDAPGLDAAVYAPGKDLRWKNDTAAPLRRTEKAKTVVPPRNSGTRATTPRWHSFLPGMIR